MKLDAMDYMAMVATRNQIGRFVGAFHQGGETRVLVQLDRIDPATEKPVIVAVPVECVQAVSLEPVEA